MAEGSKPIYRIKTEKNYRVRMRDGILIACDVYRPDAEGQFPVIFTMSPYGKDIQRLNVPAKPRALGEEWGVIEAGDTDYLVSRGYAHIIVDVRGIGYSEGTFDVCQRREQEDGYDLVEWAAEQPWCNGNCGMIGISYPAFIQYLVAAQQPPHLKAIFPHDGWGDMYRDVSHQGGIFMHGWLPDDWTTDLRMGFNASPASLGMYNEEELKRRIDKWLKHEVFNKHEKMVNSLLHPLYKPLIFDWVINEFDGPYYWERSAYTKWDKIKIPTYLSSEFHDYTVSMHLRGATEGWANIKAPKKLAFRQKAPEVPFHEFHDEIVRWYDHWLKGIDTGIMDEPPVKIWVRGAERWRYSTDFPLPETKYTNFYLAANNLLSEKGPSDNEKAFSSFKHKPVFPVTMGREPLDPMPDYLSYTTKPLNQDTEIIGYIALYLYASIATDDADFIVKVKDVSPDGSEFVLSRGWLKASHREVDKKKSKLWQPYHPHLQAEPVVPGEINEYAIEIRPIANLFKKGHQIKLEIWGCDYPADPMDLTLCWPSWSHLSYDKETSYKIYHTPKYSSHLVLPIIEGY